MRITAAFFVSLCSLCSAFQLFAQDNDAVVLEARGIAGYEDKKDRNPHLTVSTQNNNGSVKILADTLVPSGEYKEFPVEVKFFVNGSLFATQIRSIELPKPLGIDVPSSVATIPFNYSVVATVLHPNRTFTTIINGAVFSSNLVNTFAECSFAQLPAADAEVSPYVAANVASGQTTNDTATMTFESSEREDGTSDETVKVVSTLAFSSTSASGTLSITSAGSTTTVNVEGDATVENGKLESFDVASSDGKTSFSCE